MECGLLLELGEVDHTADVKAHSNQGNHKHEQTLKYEIEKTGHTEVSNSSKGLNLDFWESDLNNHCLDSGLSVM